MVVAGYLLCSTHLRINVGNDLRFVGLPNGPPSQGRLTPAKLRERCELVFQLAPEKLKNLVIVNSSLSNFEMIQACVEAAEKYAENVMVIPPLLGLLTYALKSISKCRNPPTDEIIMVVSHTTEFVDFVILRRDRNFELKIANFEHFDDQRQCEEMFPKLYDKYYPHATIFVVHDTLRSVAERIEHRFKPENCFVKSFAKWDYVLLSGGTFRAMDDEEEFNPRYHIKNFSSGYETLICNRRTGAEERHVLLPGRSPLPCNIYGFNGIPQQIKLFYFLEHYHQGDSLVRLRRDATKYTIPVTGSSEEIIGYVDERGVPYAPPPPLLSKDTVERRRREQSIEDVRRKEQDTVETRRGAPSEMVQSQKQDAVSHRPNESHQTSTTRSFMDSRPLLKDIVESRRREQSIEDVRRREQDTVDTRRGALSEVVQSQKQDAVSHGPNESHQIITQSITRPSLSVIDGILPQTSSAVIPKPLDPINIKFIFRDDNFFAIHLYQNGIMKVVSDSFDNEWSPLYLSMAEGTVEIGEKAMQRAKTFPKHVVYDVLKIIGKPFNQIQVNPEWGFELIDQDGIVYFQVKTSAGDRLFSQEIVISAFLKAMKLQTESFMDTQNNIKEIRLSTNFRLSESQKAIFKKAAAKNNLEILLFNVSDM